jgi:hypothetical protein
MFKHDYLTQTQLGKWLVAIGLRDQKGKPSTEAFAGVFCKQLPSRNDGYCWGWHAEKTTHALETAGHKLAFPPPEDLIYTPWLKGPFSSRQNSENGFEILSGDGQVSAWVFGKGNVDFVVRLLNLADQHGKLPCRSAEPV